MTMPVFLAVVVTAYKAHRYCSTMGKYQRRKGKEKKKRKHTIAICIHCALCVIHKMC
jgi:amino acid permease